MSARSVYQRLAGPRGLTLTRFLAFQRMSNELTRECERLGSWGVLGQGTGGRLVRPGSKDPVAREQLVDHTLTLKAKDLAHIDPVTGLMMPNAGAQMVIASGEVGNAMLKTNRLRLLLM